MRRLRIAFISFEYTPFILGGAGNYAVNLTGHLARLGHEVHIIAPCCQGGKLKDSVIVHQIGFINKSLLRAPSYWLNLCMKFKKIEKQVGGFDIFHSNGISDLSLSEGRVKIQRVITVHHLARDAVSIMKPSLLDRLAHPGSEFGIAPYLEKVCIRRTDRIIAVSNYIKNRVTSVYGISPERVATIYNGVQVDRTEKPKKFKMSGETVVLFVGRVNDPRKGLDFLLRAFKDVVSEIPARLLVAGSGDKQGSQRLASSLGIEKYVTFTGFVDDTTLANLYNDCRVFVSPSRLEGFGLTVVEAMSAGKPVVATKVGAIPEIIRDGENGSLVDYGDIQGLASAIKYHLSNNGISKAIGEKNRQLVKEKFTWEKTARETEKVYLELLEAKG